MAESANNYVLPSSVVTNSSSAAQGYLTTALKDKLDGIADSANNYSHPTGAGNKHVPTGGATGQFLKYSSSGTAVWETPSYTTNTNTTYSVGDGGLTQNNFTDADHTKLNNIAASANNYSHPTSAGNKHVPTGGATGQFLKYSSSGTATWETPSYTTNTNTTYSVGDGGLTQKNFTTALKDKLDGVAEGATADQDLSSYATQSYVGTQITNLVDSSPAALNTLNELAAALGDDANFSTTITNSIATKLPLAGGTLTGDLVAPSFSGPVYGAASGAPDSTIWAISRDSYPNYGIFYDEGNPDKILYKWNGETKFNINFETGALDTPSTITASGGNSSQWNTAHGWGNHASVGYVTTNTTYGVGDGGLTQNNFTDADHTKLNNIAASANNYSHPTSAGNKHVPTGGATGQFLKYSSSGTAVWETPSYTTNTNTTYSVGDGGLTQNNFTDADHTKLNNIAASANNYSHPTSAGNKHVPTGGATGQFLKYSSSGTATWETPSYTTNTNTTYSVGDGGLTQKNFTTTLKDKLDGVAESANNYVLPSSVVTNSSSGAQGYLTTALKSKLDGIADSANNYSHPTGAGNKHVPTGGSSGQFLKYSSSGTATWSTPSYTTNTNTTYSVGDGGLTQKNFTTALNTKLGNIETGATADQTAAQIYALNC